MSLITLIPLFPLVGFLINGLGYKIMPRAIAGILATGLVFASFICVCIVYGRFDSEPVHDLVYNWIQSGSTSVDFSLYVDQLTIVMLFVITGVGTLIHAYGIGYMSHDKGVVRFFAYLNLFLFFMLILVMGSNYLIMFIGWEGVGLSSYLLIGFYKENRQYTENGRKAFVMNRIGDLGFLIGIFMIYLQFGSLEFSEVFAQAQLMQAGGWSITLISLALFVGAMGKSAQLPLFTWLPDAMVGPTPVSALMHAATMVTSGIYMIVRSNVLYTLSPVTLEFVAWIGMATVFIGGTIALFQNDIKKVLAYSTVSQLGYMFLALGVMGYSSGLFHVMTHAFFKALLFLGAGSVIHALHEEQDVRKMGGLSSKLKTTGLTFLIATIAISGIPPFAGFFSKDEILAHVYQHNKWMWILGNIAAVITSFYMFRLYFLVFKGSFRGTLEQESRIHESPQVMTAPLIILAIFSAFGGFIGLPAVFSPHNRFAEFLDPVFKSSRAILPDFGHHALSHTTEYILIMVSVAGALIGSGLAFIRFGKGKNVPEMVDSYSGLRKVIFNKYYFDEIYDWTFVKPIEVISNFWGSVFDSKVLDAVVTGAGWLIERLSHLLRKTQVGSTSAYLLFITWALIVVLGFLFPSVIDGFKTFGK